MCLFFLFFASVFSFFYQGEIFYPYSNMNRKKNRSLLKEKLSPVFDTEQHTKNVRMEKSLRGK